MRRAITFVTVIAATVAILYLVARRSNSNELKKAGQVEQRIENPASGRDVRAAPILVEETAQPEPAISRNGLDKHLNELKDALNVLLSDDTLDRRQASLTTLAAVSEITPDLLQAVARVSREDASSEIKTGALKTMTTWMGQHPDLFPQIVDELLTTMKISVEPEIRTQAIEAIADLNRSLPTNILDQVEAYLKTAPRPQDRALAARALASANGESRAWAISALQEAYVQEQDLNTRRSIMTQIVRAATTQSPEILKQLPTGEPLLAQDATDYLEILQSGVTDPEAIRNEKTNRDTRRGTRLQY